MQSGATGENVHCMATLAWAPYATYHFLLFFLISPFLVLKIIFPKSHSSYNFPNSSSLEFLGPKTPTFQ